MSFIRFSHPQYLLLLPLVLLYTWWVMRASLAELGRTRGRLAAGVRAALLILCVLALAGLQLVRPTSQLCTVFVVDVSDSILPAQQEVVLDYIHRAVKKMRPGDSAALVAFGGEAMLDHAPEDRAAFSKIVSVPGTTRTNIAAGIQLAMASFPQEAGKQVVLFSDGNENLGNALDQAGLARGNDVRVSVVPLARDLTRGEVLVQRVDTPTQARQGAPFQVNVLVDALRPAEGTITLFRNREQVETRPVRLPAGKTVVAFEESVTHGGLYQYRAVLDVQTAHDTVPDNNVAYAYTRVKGKPTVLVVEGAPGDGARLARALRGHDIEVQTGGPERLPSSLAECALYDSIVVANLPAWRMTPAQMAIIRSAVRDTGMGFAMVGGPDSFGAGGYYQTPIEDALPVTMDMKRRKQIPQVTLVIVIDVSGSMSATEDGVPKVRLAGEAAKAAVAPLQAIDRVCVIGYDTPDGFVYTVPITSAGNKGSIYRQIDKLAAGGGGIMTFSSLKEARKAMRGSKSPVKHIILCADATDTEEQEGCIPLVREMRAQDRITLSVIGFGSRGDPHVQFHKDLARAGGGNAYLAERLSNLPQIFSRDVMLASRSLLVEKPFSVRPENTVHPASRHIAWGSAPPLLGYVCTTKQESPLAQVLLSSPDDDPVLATWSYGLGRSLAFTSDATARWGAHWLQWSGYEPFWSQALRWTLRQGATSHLQTTLMEQDGRATVAVDAVTPEGEFRNLLELRAHISHVNPITADGPKATSETITLEQTAPGHYEGSFDTRATGVYSVTVEERQGEKTASIQMASLVIPYSPEFQAVQPNMPLLMKIAAETGGVTDPKPEMIFGKLRFGSRSLRDLWPALLLLLACLFILDVAVRRVLLPWDEFLAAVREVLAERLPKWRWQPAGGPAPRHAPTLDTLLNTKQNTRAPRDGTTMAGTLRNLREQAGAAPKPAFLPPASDAADNPAPTEPAEPAAPPAVPAGTVGNLLQKKREREGK